MPATTIVLPLTSRPDLHESLQAADSHHIGECPSGERKEHLASTGCDD